MGKYDWLLTDRLREVKVIDTHEHLWDESYRLLHPGDWTLPFHQYSITSFNAAGMTESEKKEFYSEETSHDRKWEIFSRYFPLAKNTAYVKAALIAIKDIYGIDRIDSDSMQELNKKIKESVKPGFHRKVLREMGNIDYCMVNCFDLDENNIRYPLRYWGDTELMRPDFFVDTIVLPCNQKLVERETGIDCSTFSGWLKAIDALFEKYAGSCCSVKVGLGYAGSLDFKPGVSHETAEAYYDRHMKNSRDFSDYKDMRPLADYMFHYVLEKAADYKLPLKFHTGIYAGYDYLNYEAIQNNVKHLVALATAHPECDFAAMHISYPFYNELVMAIKNVRNLYAEMSWSWIIDRESAKDFLKKALCAAPVTKITGFGGDYGFVENAYGHLQIARHGISEALSDLVESGYFDLEEAVDAGRYLLRDSAERLFEKK